MQQEELKKINTEIERLENKETELANWLKKNVDSHNFDEVRTEWHNVRFKLESLRDKKRNNKGVFIKYNQPI
jgi:septal ring factor EnvC (AmiA/AmiB activator)